MSEVIIFGDIEAALVTKVAADLTSRGKSATVVDEDYKPSSPTKRPDRLVIIKRGGGAKRDIVTDGANIEFECYDTTEAAACELANLVRGISCSLVGVPISGLTAYRIDEFAGPARLPHPTSANPRYVFTHRVFFRGAAE